MTLALPKIQRRPMERLATPDIKLPLKEAEARIAMAQAIGDTATAAAGVFKKYADREDKRELREATLAVHKADSEFVRTYGGVEEFDPKAIDDEDFIELTSSMNSDAPIPAHRVYAEWRKKNYEKAVQNASSGISSERTQRGFQDNQEFKMTSIYSGDTLRATKSQIQYNAKKTMNEVETFLLNRDYGGARLAIDMSDISSTAKEAAHKDIKTREQSNYFNETIERRNIDSMTQALDNLTTNDPATTSMLDAQSQKVFANQLRTAINGEKTAIKAGATTQFKMVTDDLKKQIDAVESGRPVDSSAMQANMKVLANRDPKLVRDANWAVDNQEYISRILMSSPTDQMAELAALRETSKGGLEQDYVIQRLEKSISDGFKQRRTDTMKWGREMGMIVPEPIDYSSPATMVESLKARVKPAILMQDTYGTFTGFLETGSELEEFGSRFENAPDKLAFAEAINTALGDYAEPFYEQLKKYNIGETTSLAGQLMSWGPQYRQTASNIIKGARLRKEDNLTQIKMKEVNDELNSYAVSAFGGMFTGNPKHQSLMVEALKDVYAVTGEKEEAFQQLTGGSFEFNKYIMQAPVPGMSGGQYERWLNTLTPEYWSNPEMQAYNYTPEQLRKSILNGELIQEGIGKGVSHLIAPDGSIVKKADGVTNFQFKYDPDAPVKAMTRGYWPFVVPLRWGGWSRVDQIERMMY